jgi:hypothetical protein
VWENRITYGRTMQAEGLHMILAVMLLFHRNRSLVGHLAILANGIPQYHILLIICPTFGTRKHKLGQCLYRSR